MSLFSRRRRAETPDEAEPAVEVPAPAAVGRAHGPWDVSEVAEPGARTDLGAVWIPEREGLQLRLEMDRSSQRVVAVNLALAGSALEIKAFAAPRTAGIWDDLRAEIAASVTREGGTVEEVDGPFGRELLARLPLRDADGRPANRPARFIGVDGPRWFLRGVLYGRAAVDPEAALDLEHVFADVVVVRGADARPPRDLLTLHPPGRRPAPPEEPAAGLPDVLARGPEITEVR